MDCQELFEQREKRVAAATALEKTDRTPVVLEMAAFAARVTNITVAKFISDALISAQAMIDTAEKVGGADGIDYCCLVPLGLSLTWLSKIKLPGRDLPDDSMWQIHEEELMKEEDYDLIVKNGYPDWMTEFFLKHFGEEVMNEILAQDNKTPEIIEMWKKKGIPVLRDCSISIPYEKFCGARSFSNFIHDLYRIPDKVQAAMDATLPYLYLKPDKIQRQKDMGVKYVWVGGWRSASSFLSRSLWDRFVFPYFEKILNNTIEAGFTPILHFDSDWTRDLARFREFPKGKCILELDGMTDIRKAKEIVGDTMCIMGDVPASLLKLGTPEEVYNYSTSLIKDIGPTGFILHSGCDIPIDAKLENVQAMVAAATGK